MAIKTYPLNNIEYQAEDAELFHCTRTSGVYASGHFPVSVSGTDNNITVGKGIGWIKNTEFSGKVFASKEATTLNAGVPDASLPRIDAVVVCFDANQNETYFTIKQGSTGSTPTPPEVERGEYIYELHLYHIRRRPGATAITPGDITDLRMDANYCGLMADSVTQVDMSAINAQVREFISDWENQIANVTDGKMIESPEYPGCYYRMNHGVKEWLNPPMMEDVEYPTTKRQAGKRVYTKLLKSRMQAGSISLPGVERIVNVVAVADRVSSSEKLMFQLPAFELPADNPRVQNLQIYYNDDTIFIQAVYAKGTYDLFVTVEYTKLVDEVAYTNVTANGDNIIVETNGDVSAHGDNLNVEMFTTVSADGGAYIRRLTINGVAYDLAVSQAGSGEPGTAYPGVPGQTYMDTDTGDLYKCVSAENGVYVWESANEATKLTAKKRYRDTWSKVSIEADGPQIMKVSGATDGVESTEDFVIIRGLYNPVLPQDAANKQYVDSKIGSGGNGSGGNQNYTLPVATPSVLGGVKPTEKTEGMTQPVGVDEDGRLWTAPTAGNGGGEVADKLVGVLPQTIPGAGYYLLSDTDATVTTDPGDGNAGPTNLLDGVEILSDLVSYADGIITQVAQTAWVRIADLTPLLEPGQLYTWAFESVNVQATGGGFRVYAGDSPDASGTLIANCYVYWADENGSGWVDAINTKNGVNEAPMTWDGTSRYVSLMVGGAAGKSYKLALYKGSLSDESEPVLTLELAAGERKSMDSYIGKTFYSDAAVRLYKTAEQTEETPAVDQRPLAGKHGLFIGDSLTTTLTGADSETGGWIHAEKSYPEYFAEKTGCVAHIYAASGASALSYFENKYPEIDFSIDYDFAIIMLGTNAALGDVYGEAYASLVEKLAEDTGGKTQIFLVTPPYNNYATGSSAKWALDSNPVVHEMGQTYCLPVIDTYHDSGINQFNGALYRPIDDLHFNDAGYERLAGFIANQVLSKYWL